MDDETDVFYITFLLPDEVVAADIERDNYEAFNTIRDPNVIAAAPYRTLGGAEQRRPQPQAQPQAHRVRDFYRPRYNYFMDFLSAYINNMPPDATADAEANDVQNHSFFNDVVAKPVITDEQIAAVLAKTPQVAFGTIAETECDICYWPYDSDSVIRHHANCCGKYTCENCFRKMIAEKLDCPYCIRPL